MSGKNNVNPDHYKVAGRDTQDDRARARRETPPTGKPRRKKGDPAPNFIPGAPPAHETPAAADDSEERRDRR
ncbi:MAG TPA: hypothetical protein VIE36_17435 [Methylomirabilota bacterium]